MRLSRLVPILAVGLLGLVRAEAPAASDARSAGRPTPRRGAAAVAPRRLPLAFEANRGQTDPRVRFLVRDRGLTAFVCAEETVFTLHSGVPAADVAGEDAGEGTSAAAHERRTEVVRMRFVGGSATARVEGCDPLPGACHYLLGRDSSHWITDVPTCARVVVRDVCPGVDQVWHGGDDGRLEYDLVLAPGTDVRAVAFDLEGARSTAVAPDGSLVARTDFGELRHGRPVAWQIVEGSRRAVDVAFDVAPDGRVRFDVGPHDARIPLVIDPALTYSTYFGGGGSTGVEYASGVAVGGDGAAYVVGVTSSLDFPTQSALQSANGGGAVDAVVTKLTPSGTSIAYSTFLGGSADEEGRAIAVDGSGAAYVTGYTRSADFPTQGTSLGSAGGSGDVFLAKLGSSGATLSYASVFGGTSYDSGRAIAVDSGGAAYVTGNASSGFPTQSALQANYGGGGASGDVFVLKVNSSGTALVYSTFLGGSGIDLGFAVAVDTTGAVYVAGDTSSADFPLQGAIQSARNGGGDAFAAKLDASGSSLNWSTYLGGTGKGTERAYGLAVDSAGAAYVAGTTDSADFPTTQGAVQTVAGGGPDAFVVKVSASGAALDYATYLGGASYDEAYGVAVDSSGRATLAGLTRSLDFPTIAAVQPSLPGGLNDAFVSRLDTSGVALVQSSYLGGSGGDYAKGVALTSSGDAIVVGATNSVDFPTQSAVQGSLAGGGNDQFVARLPWGSGGGVVTPRPAAPTQLTATYLGGASVALSWTDASNDETGFRVERMPQGYTYSLLTTTGPDQTVATDAPLVGDTTYTYRVRAFNAGGNSDWSNEVSITTVPGLPPPPRPSGPTLLRATPLDDGTIGLTWRDNSRDEVGFRLERGEGGADLGQLAFLRSDVTAAIDDAVHPGWPNTYRVAAISLQGSSPWSDVVGATAPATLDLVLRSGRFEDSPRPRRSKIRVEASFAPAADVEPREFDPRANGLELRLGFANAPVAVSIPAGDPRWKPRRKTKRARGRTPVVKPVTWTSAKGVLPTVSVIVDLRRRRLTASVSGFDVEQVGASPIRVLVASGADGGAHAADWRESKHGTYSFRAK